MFSKIRWKIKGKIARKTIVTATLMIVVFVMSLGYAALSQYMEIEGMAMIEKRWNVGIDDVTVSSTNGGVGVKSYNTSIPCVTAVSLDSTLPNLNSTVTYTIKLKNVGNVGGMLHSIDKIEDKNTNITYTISGVSVGTTIAAGGTVTATVTVRYKSGATSVSTEPKKMMIGFNFVEYKSGSGGSSSFPRKVTVVANNGTIENGTSLSNLIINGGYETNNGWTLSGASIISSGCYSGNRCLSFDDSGLSMTTQTITKADGTTPMVPSINHKYYGRIMFKSSSNYTVADSRFEWYTGDEEGARLIFAFKDTQTNNKWQLMSSIQQVTINTHLSKSWYIRNFTVSESEAVYADEAMIIDLTAAYGSGNEPSKEWVDENISFFEGTVSHISSTVSGQATYKISPSVGYVFDRVVGCNASYNTSTNTLTVSNTSSEEICTVQFKKSTSSTVTLSSKILSDNTAQSDSGLEFKYSSEGCYRENGEDVCNAAKATNGLYYTSTNTENNKTTYYFRGAVTNNYVRFADFYWKIIRINEDGSIRLIYNGTSATATGSSVGIGTKQFNSDSVDNAYVGYMYGTPGSSSYASTHANTNSSIVKGVLDTWYETNLKMDYGSYIADAGFCNDRSIASRSGLWDSNDTARGYGTNKTYYGAYNRLVNNVKPQFACPNASNDLFTTSSSSKGNKALTNPIGLITADEVWYAGGISYTSNSTYYLHANYQYWTMSPEYFNGSYAYDYFMYQYGDLTPIVSTSSNRGVRPVINLKSTVTLSSTNPSGCSSQNGSASCPYVIG